MTVFPAFAWLFVQTASEKFVKFSEADVKSFSEKQDNAITKNKNSYNLRAISKHRVLSRDVTAAMLVYPTNPPGIEFYYHANIFFCFGGKTRLLITRVKTL